MTNIINYLQALLHRLENRFIGSVESHLAPLQAIVTKLEQTAKRAEAKADEARVAAVALNNRAEVHKDTVVAAGIAAAKISQLLK